MPNSKHISSVIALFICGCTKGMHGGDPALSLASTNGTARIFPTPDSLVVKGVSNAFSHGYNGMLFLAASGVPSFFNGHIPTNANGFVLMSGMDPYINVPLQGKEVVAVPYFPCFYIGIDPITSSSAKILVRTISASVIDGYETGLHGGWAHHSRNVPPVQFAEDKLFDVISNAVVRR